MANKQIYELTTRTFDGDSLLPISVENPDSSTATEYPQLTGKTSGNALSDFVANSQQYATDLDTESKTITGAINELHSSIGANTYNTSSTYNKGDIVIYNGTLYACKDNSVTGAWDATKWDDTTLQPKTDNTLATTDKTVVGAINELKSDMPIASEMGGLTAQTGVTNLNGGSVKMGNGRFINHNINITSAFSANQKLIQLANSTDYPSGNKYLVLIGGGNLYKLTLSNTGGIFATATIPTGEYIINGNYSV